MPARRENCRACGAPLLVQLVGHRAALHVRADATPMPYQQAIALTGPNWLAWHAHRLGTGEVDLWWIDTSTHPTDCTQDVIDHHCQPPQQDALFT